MSIFQFYRGGIVVMAAYLVWVWSPYSASISANVPLVVEEMSRDQAWHNAIYSPDVSYAIHVLRKPLAFISLFMMWGFRNFGRWGFLVFSVLGPLGLISENWTTSVYWYEGLSWAVHWVQGGLLLLSFYGPVAVKFSEESQKGDKPEWMGDKSGKGTD